MARSAWAQLEPPEKFDENFVQTAAVLPVLLGEFAVADSPIDGKAVPGGEDRSTRPAAQIAQPMRSLNAQ